jgi:2-C-methyl-D-erythritol 4-phosphate cytidylyltransferase
MNRMSAKPIFAAVLFTAAPDASSSPQGAMVKVDGREAMLRSVELFVNRDNVKQILVGFSPADAEVVKSKFASHLMLLGIKVATGGPALKDQLAAALAKLAPEITHVVVHDAARPAVSQPELESLLDAAEKSSCVGMVAKVNAPVAELDPSGTFVQQHAAKSLRSILYPMAMKKSVFEEACKNGIDSLLSRLTPLESSPLNLRCNGSGDAGLLKAMIALLPKPKIKGPSNPFEEASW